MGNLFSIEPPESALDRGNRLREEAWAHAQRARDLAADSQAAYRRRDGARAKQLSDERKRYKGLADKQHREASKLIFEGNNEGRGHDTVDVHGLLVEEALEQVARRVGEVKERDGERLTVITGRGLHSRGGAARIKPQVMEWAEREKLECVEDPRNAGCVIIKIERSRPRSCSIM
ncbi:hypothetical protein CLOM_g24479 [Closterium sp. NIES-68]|nr:hypothetical protein CLOM_g24479 [Closterium sp. NIES-68]GJP85080.1 hypothetical protein CLOP_g15181 [Closterium sp. NIES-67]